MYTGEMLPHRWMMLHLILFLNNILFWIWMMTIMLNPILSLLKNLVERCFVLLPALIQTVLSQMMRAIRFVLSRLSITPNLDLYLILMVVFMILVSGIF